MNLTTALNSVPVWALEALLSDAEQPVEAHRPARHVDRLAKHADSRLPNLEPRYRPFHLE